MNTEAGSTSYQSDEYFHYRTIPEPKEEIVIAVVVCGMRVDETLNMVKSALLFNTDKHPLRFVIVTEDTLKERFKEKVNGIRGGLEKKLMTEFSFISSWTTGRW